jgi:hypothetical protein
LATSKFGKSSLIEGVSWQTFSVARMEVGDSPVSGFSLILASPNPVRKPSVRNMRKIRMVPSLRVWMDREVARLPKPFMTTVLLLTKKRKCLTEEVGIGGCRLTNGEGL